MTTTTSADVHYAEQAVLAAADRLVNDRKTDGLADRWWQLERAVTQWRDATKGQ